MFWSKGFFEMTIAAAWLPRAWRREGEEAPKVILSLVGLGIAYWCIIGRPRRRAALLAQFRLQDTIDGAPLLEAQERAKSSASQGDDGEWMIGTSPNGSQHGGDCRVGASAQRPSVCFQGSGCVIVYHIGVAQYLQEHFDLRDATFCAASGGSIVAAMLALDMPMELAYRENCRLAKLSRRPPLGPFGRILDDVAGAFEDLLRSWTEQEVRDRLRGRLVLSLTHLMTGAPRLLCRFSSKRDLVDAVWSSMNCVLFLCRFRRVQGELFVDGGLTNNAPVVHKGTVRVSPTDPSAHVVLEEPPGLLEFLVPGDDAYMVHMHSRGYEAARREHHVWLRHGFQARPLAAVQAAKNERALLAQEVEEDGSGGDSRVSFSW